MQKASMFHLRQVQPLYLIKKEAISFQQAVAQAKQSPSKI